MRLDLGLGTDSPHDAELRAMIIEVICGCAPGADLAGERWAKAVGVPVHHEPITKEDVQRWGKYLAPKMRNRRMAERGDLAIVFWDGKSSGSPDLVARMVGRGKVVSVVPTRPVRRRRAGKPTVGEGQPASEPAE